MTCRKLVVAVDVLAAGFCLVAGIGACSSPEPDPDACGPPHATFRLVVDAQDGYVPGDVRIHVRSGSGEEEFDAKVEGVSPKVVFCEVERVSGDGGEEGPIELVTCDLWTDGAATVRVTAQGYPEVERDLEAEWEPECGLKLTEERITLERETP